MTTYFGRVLFEGNARFAVKIDRLVGLLEQSFLTHPQFAVVEWHSLDEVRVLPPVTPRVVLAVGRNYRAHAAELGNEVPTEPLFFLKQPGTVIADGDSVLIPDNMGRIDFEGELVAVIGRRVFGLKNHQEAMDAIFGYTIGNDITARALQKRDGQWVRAKGFDTFGPIGPWIAQGLDSHNLRLVTTVNHTIHQDGNTQDMIFSVEDLVFRASQFMTLEPGDVIFTGTPEGVGPVQEGDVVQITIEGVGTLSNSIKNRD